MGHDEIRQLRPKTDDVRPRYDAFLSYSHTVDGPLGLEVQRGLHRLAKPWYKTRSLRVFRDQESMSANDDLRTTIDAALHNSRFFILMASPEAAHSRWVAREVEYWRDHRESHTFLILLTGGSVAWDAAAGDFDWADTTALPTTLRGWFRAEPLWVPLDRADHNTQLSLRNGRFRDAIATLAAPLHGVDKDDLDGEDVRQHRRTSRLRNGVIVALVLLTVASVVLTVVARGQTNVAEAQLQRAIAKGLVTRSEALSPTDPTLSRLLSVAAWRLDPTNDARGAMLEAYNRPGMVATSFGGGPVAFSADGRTMASGGAGTVQLWDAITQQPIGDPMTGHAGFVGRMAFSPDGTMLATGSDDGTVRLWSIASRQQIGLPLVEDAGTITAVSFSKDGRAVVVGSADGTIGLWDPMSRHRITDPIPGYNDGPVPISDDGTLLAYYDQDMTVHLWDIAANSEIGSPMAGFVGSVYALAFSPDGSMLVTGGSDGAVRIWDTATNSMLGDPLSGFTGGIESGGVKGVGFSADGSTVSASGLDGTIRSWDTASHRQVGDTLNGDSAISWASFSASGDTIAISGVDGTAQLWDLSGRNHRGVPFARGVGLGYGTAISPDGRLMAVGDDQGTVQLWDIGSGTTVGPPLTDPESVTVMTVVFSPDGRRLAVGGHNSRVRVWDLDTSLPVGKPLLNSGLPLGFAADGNQLIVQPDLHAGVQVWDIAGSTAVTQFDPDDSGGSDQFASAAMTHDGGVVVTGSFDGRIELRDGRDGHSLVGPILASTQPISAVAVSPDGGTVATGDGKGMVRLWDARSGAPMGDPLLGSPGDRVIRAVFSPDGATLVAVAEHGSAQLWDTASHQPLGPPLERYGETIGSVAFSSDGRTLATTTALADPEIRLWQVHSSPTPDSELCAQVGHSLTTEQWKHDIPELPYQSIC